MRKKRWLGEIDCFIEENDDEDDFDNGVCTGNQ